MKTELKDVLHYYTGQNAHCFLENDDKTLEFDTTGEIMTVHTNYIEGKHYPYPIKVNAKRKSYSLESYYDFNHVKPILRPLSNMTEAEAKEFILDVLNMKIHFGWREFNYHIDKGFLTIIGDNNNYTIIKNWGKEGDYQWIFNCSYSMADVIWLLKRGFDIFGLIESNQAVDITKISEASGEVNNSIA